MNRWFLTWMAQAMLASIAIMPARGDDPEQVSAETPSATIVSKTAAPGKKRALIVCGLSGDADHHKPFAEMIATLHQGLTNQLGFAASDVQILFGDAPQESDPEIIQSAAKATREELEKSVAALRESLRPEDVFWFISLGHSHYDGKNSWWNLSGPDIHQTDFGKLFHGIECRQQVFILTTPTSGYYIKPLSAKGRVIFTATQADVESNETEFPLELARVLAAPPDAREFDFDGDKAVTLFDLYLTVVRNLAQSYVQRELLASEHALLDDNGDGRGTEVQIDYLNEEQGGRARRNRPFKSAVPPTADGALSKAILLNPK